MVNAVYEECVACAETPAAALFLSLFRCVLEVYVPVSPSRVRQFWAFTSIRLLGGPSANLLVDGSSLFQLLCLNEAAKHAGCWLLFCATQLAGGGLKRVSVQFHIYFWCWVLSLTSCVSLVCEVEGIPFQSRSLLGIYVNSGFFCYFLLNIAYYVCRSA